MTLVLESISFFFSIEQKLEASRKLLLLQDAAVREKTSLYQKGFYLLLQSFLFSKDPFFFSLLRLPSSSSSHACFRTADLAAAGS